MIGRRLAGAVLALAMVLSLTAATGTAFAAGTGDDPAFTEDVLTSEQQATKAALEAQQYMTVQGTEAPYRYLSTPSVRQERSYWCGPATVQCISWYLGTGGPQSAFAAYLGTTQNGTPFTKVDDALRYYVAKPYYYYGGLTSSGFYSRVADSLLYHTMPVAADVHIDASVWPYYNFDHDGHIVPIEAFDWRNSTIRLNDVYDESYWILGGGKTFGHTTYPRDVVWRGVYSHWRRAIVSAP